MKTVLIVGQTPPPFGGQAVMIQYLVNAQLENIKTVHVRMAFSKEMDEIGHFKIRKLFHLITIIIRIFWYRIRYRPAILYYPPAGPDKVPFYRDLVILIGTRWLFKKTVFHFHAGGLSELYPKLNPFLKRCYQIAYGCPDATIRLSEKSPDDGKYINPKKEYIIPNGIPDMAFEYANAPRNKMNNTNRILYMGVLREDKGVKVLIEAASELRKRGLVFKLVLAGRWVSVEFKQQIMSMISKSELDEYIEFTGVVSGEDKWELYKKADIFCFPTYFASENLSVVLLEAMQFALPIVTTDWRANLTMVEDGINGYAAEIMNSEAVANKLETLLKSENLRTHLGKASRKRFCERYDVHRHFEMMEQVFLSI